MKLLSWSINSTTSQGLGRAFFSSPYLSIRSLNYHPRRDGRVFLRFLLFLFLTAFTVVLTNTYLVPLNYFEVLIFAPTLYFFTEMLGAFGQVLFFRKETIPIHRHPLSATSLAEFWGRNWNLWVQDWLRDITRGLANRKHYTRTTLVFLISGLFHELMVNLPYWLIYKKSYFGTMLAYFLIQAVALWIDKKVIKHWPRIWKRLYLWLAVILPSPLFINVPLLTFFGLTHD